MWQVEAEGRHMTIHSNNEVVKRTYTFTERISHFSLMIQIEHYFQLIVARAFFSGSISQVWRYQFYIYHQHELHASRIVNIEWHKKKLGSVALRNIMLLVALSHSFLICIAMKLLGMIVHYAPYAVTVELRWLEHWWLVYHGCFEHILKSLKKKSLSCWFGII